MMNLKEIEYLTFDDILKKEGYVLCDTSISSSPSSDWYWSGVYDAKNFAGIDSGRVRTEIEYLKCFTELLQNPNVLVARGVSLEFQRMRDIIADKIKFLKITEEYLKNRKHYHNGENKMTLLREVHDLLHDSYMLTKNISFSPRQKGEYNALERIVMDVTEQTQAKRDLDKVYDYRAKPKNVVDFHTDEQTIAAALYFSVIENRQGCILARDSDMERILENTLNYLFYSRHRQLNEFFSQAIKNRIAIYFSYALGQANLDFDSSKFFPSKKKLEKLSVL